MKHLRLLLAVALVTFAASNPVEACGGGGHVQIQGCGGCMGGGHMMGPLNGGGGFVMQGNPYYRFPGVGGGQVAFRRSRRLARRSRRAAWFGFYGRANRLAWRSVAAFNRGAFRAGWF